MGSISTDVLVVYVAWRLNQFFTLRVVKTGQQIITAGLKLIVYHNSQFPHPVNNAEHKHTVPWEIANTKCKVEYRRNEILQLHIT